MESNYELVFLSYPVTETDEYVPEGLSIVVGLFATRRNCVYENGYKVYLRERQQGILNQFVKNAIDSLCDRIENLNICFLLELDQVLQELEMTLRQYYDGNQGIEFSGIAIEGYLPVAIDFESFERHRDTAVKLHELSFNQLRW